MKKAVMFDLDNTLYEYDKPHKIALKSVHKELNKKIKISSAKFNKLFKLSKEEMHKELAGTASSHNRVLYFQRLIEKTNHTVEPDLILTLYKTYWDTFLKAMKLKSDALPLLRELKKKGIKTAIVSDLTTHIQLRKMKQLKISNYIDYLVTSEEAGSEKPHSIMFLLALNKLNLLPSDAMMVGDNSVTDIEGANAVGIDTVLIGQKFFTRIKGDYRKPDYKIKNLKEVLKLIHA